MHGYIRIWDEPPPPPSRYQEGCEVNGRFRQRVGLRRSKFGTALPCSARVRRRTTREEWTTVPLEADGGIAFYSFFDVHQTPDSPAATPIVVKGGGRTVQAAASAAVVFDMAYAYE